ncbi:ZBT40 protein, partial [Thryothorus ludovicianus]|nr:ZBT40 protein [Thryothorus ludovicianus]
IYSGKLPLGKRYFTKVISVADSLNMFNVAVSCKNLLRALISCSAQDQVVRRVSSQEADSSGNQAEANYLPQYGRPDEEKTFIILTQSFFFTWPCRSRNGSRCFSFWHCESCLGSPGHDVK